MSLLKSIIAVASGTTVSRVLGFVRAMCIARFLGASMMADAFFVALRFPNLFRSLFAEGSLNVAFVPLLSEQIHTKGKEQARLFSQATFSFLFYVLLIFTLVVEILMPQLTFLLAPGFHEIAGKLELTTSLSRITFPFLMCISLISLYSGILNAFDKFWVAAFSPAFLNIMMIFCLFFLTPFITNPYAPAYALSIGVLLSGLVQFVFLFWHVKKLNMTFSLLSPKKALFHMSTGVKTLLKKMAPGVVGAGVYQINLFFDTLFVSFVGAGAISWLNYAHHLFQLPVGVIGAAIGTALLPLLSKHIKLKETNEALKQLNRGIELSVALSTASMMGLFLLAMPIISILFEHGAFTATDSVKTAQALQVFVLGLPAYMLIKTISPFFYAKGDTKTPVKIAIIGVVLNAILAITFMQFWGYLGVALATSITVWVNLIQYIIHLRKQGDFALDDICAYRLPRILSAVFVMSVGIYTSLFYINQFWHTYSLILSILILFGLIFIGMSLFFISLIVFKGILISDIKQLVTYQRKAGKK